MSLKRSLLYSISAVSITNTEYSIPFAASYSSGTNKTDAAAIQLILDPANITDADEFTGRIYEKTVSGGTQKCIHQRRFRLTQAGLWLLPATGDELMVKNGWDVTLQRTAGSDRTLTARVEACTGVNITELYGRSNITLGTEYGIVAGSTSLATKTDQPAMVQAIIYDRGNMVKGDEFEIRVAEAAAVGATKRTLWTTRIFGAQICPTVTDWIPARNGWEISVKKVSASDRAFDLSVRGMS